MVGAGTSCNGCVRQVWGLDSVTLMYGSSQKLGRTEVLRAQDFLRLFRVVGVVSPQVERALKDSLKWTSPYHMDAFHTRLVLSEVQVSHAGPDKCCLLLGCLGW